MEARRTIAEKRKARKLWQISRYPADKSVFNTLTSELKNLLQQEDNKQFESEIVNLDPTKATNYSLWKKTEKTAQVKSPN